MDDEALRAYYRGTLDNKLVTLTTAMLDLEADRADAEQHLRGLAHQMRGSAGSFGFPELGQAAARVELAPAEQLLAESQALVALLKGAVAS